MVRSQASRGLDADRGEQVVTIAGAAKQLMRPLHDRMPVILPPDDCAAWLGDAAAREVVELLRPCPSEGLSARRAGAAVNGAGNDGPECVETVE